MKNLEQKLKDSGLMILGMIEKLLIIIYVNPFLWLEVFWLVKYFSTGILNQNIIANLYAIIIWFLFIIIRIVIGV